MGARPRRRLVASLLRNKGDLADPPFPQPVAPQPVGGQQLIQGAAPDLSGDVRPVGGKRVVNESATARCELLKSACQRTTSPARSRPATISSKGVSQTVSASGIRSRSAAVRGRPSSSVNANRPPAGSAPDTSPSSVSLSANASMVSSSSTTSNGPGGIGGIRDTSKRHGRSPARSRAMSMALALESTPRYAATQLASDEPSRARRCRSTGRVPRLRGQCRPDPPEPGSPRRS